MSPKSVTDTDREIGKLVRARRLDLKMSQTDLGDALGVTFQQIQKYEKGSNRIGAGRLTEVAKALNVPVAYFYPAASKSGPDYPSVLTDFLSLPNASELAKAYLACAQPARAAMLTMARALSNPQP